MTSLGRSGLRLVLSGRRSLNALDIVGLAGVLLLGRNLGSRGFLKDSLRLPNRVEKFNGRLDNAFFRID